MANDTGEAAGDLAGRLRELARATAFKLHAENIIATASHPDALHYGAFDTCDHSDCQLVRAALADRVGAPPPTALADLLAEIAKHRHIFNAQEWVPFGAIEVLFERAAEGSPRAPHAQERKTP